MWRAAESTYGRTRISLKEAWTVHDIRRTAAQELALSD
jgi:hypothetical protein